jgi:transposase InsO family protein
MRIRSNLRGTKGFVTAWNRMVRFRYMITEIAKRRMKILVHWEKHGIASTLDAFEVKQRTLFLWKRSFEEGGKKVEALNPKKRTPHRKRARTWDIRILDEIKRIREKYPNLGKEKLHPLLADFCEVQGIGTCPKPVTIGRLIADMGGLRVVPQKVTGTGRIVKVNRQKVLRKPKGFVALYPGHCIALDTVEKQRNGRRMYIITALDLHTRIPFALGTRSHSSRTAAQFFLRIQELFPYPVHTVLTDNGSEFKKHVRTLLKEQNITHYHTYPRTPKMNAHCESFNGTIQDEFIDFHTNLLFDDITAFNEKLSEYLTFFNTKRVHGAFKNKLTPFAVLNRSEYYREQLPEECKNGWTYSSP